MRDKFEDLEESLRNLPGVRPDSGFNANLRSKLLAEHKRKVKPGRLKLNSQVFKYTSLAAAFVLVVAGWLAFFQPEKDSGSSNIGPLFMAQAQASNTGAPQITLGTGLDGLRQVQFKIKESLPAGPGEGNVFRLKHGQMTADQAMDLARRMGIEDAKLIEDGSTIPDNRHVYIAGKDSELVVWTLQGSWYYSRRSGGTAGGQSQQDPETAALHWLKSAGLLPGEDYSVEQNKPDPQVVEIILRPETAPDGSPLTGFVPEIRVMVTSGGRVTQANGTWYAEEQAAQVGLLGYAEAIDALKRGEGFFEAKNYRHYQAGTATVDNVQTAYQLAYAIDFTPYLVPVAVFSGEYKPEGEPAERFTATVPLLKNHVRPNSGNFTLETEFPAAPAAMGTLLERDSAVTRKELPRLAAFFNIGGQPLEDGSIRDARGEISPTSWDGGWLYRSNTQGQDGDAEAISEARVLEAATRLVKQIPVLPGVPGEPLIKYEGKGFSTVVFPLLYKGIPVASNGPPGYGSFISVQVGPAGDIWSVNCTRPMAVAAGKKNLLTPQEAWQQLLANNSLVNVEGFFGRMPGDRFAAPFSSVTEVELAAYPRHPELVRNDSYDLVYVFKGVSRMGNREINFTAFVGAVK